MWSMPTITASRRGASSSEATLGSCILISSLPCGFSLRRSIVGTHPGCQRLGASTGLGTKAVDRLLTANLSGGIRARECGVWLPEWPLLTSRSKAREGRPPVSRRVPRVLARAEFGPRWLASARRRSRAAHTGSVLRIRWSTPLTLGAQARGKPITARFAAAMRPAPVQPPSARRPDQAGGQHDFVGRELESRERLVVVIFGV